MVSKNSAREVKAGHSDSVFYRVPAPNGVDDATVAPNHSSRESSSNGSPNSPLPQENESSDVCEEWEKTGGHYSVSYLKPRAKGCNRPAAVRTRGKYFLR